MGLGVVASRHRIKGSIVPALTVPPEFGDGGGEGKGVHGGHGAQPEVELQPAPGRRHDGHPDQEVVLQRREVTPNDEVRLSDVDDERVN